MNIDTLYFIALAEASENDETDYALALSIFYRLLVGGEDVVLH